MDELLERQLDLLRGALCVGPAPTRGARSQWKEATRGRG